MTLDEKIEKLKQIKDENLIWLIYIFLIFLCFYSNKYEKNYILFENNHDKKRYKELTILIFSIALIIYLYFFYDSYKGIKKLKATDSQKKKDLSNLNLLGSTLILISGLIFLYIAITDTDLEVEVAFS